MKKWMALLLCLALACSMCACAAIDSVELPPLPKLTEEPTAAASEAPQQEDSEEKTEEAAAIQPSVDRQAANRVTVNFEKTSYENYDPSAGIERILTFSYVTPKIRIEGRDEAAAKINEYIAMLDETYYTGNDYGDGPSSGYNGMLEAAEDNYTYAVTMRDRSLPLEFSASRTARVARIDSRMINLVFDSYEYTGGAHGFYADRAYVFDTETGERLKLEALAAEGEDLQAALISGMKELVKADPEYYEEHLAEDFVAESDYDTAFSALLRDGAWYFNNEGLVIFSDLYELAPYAAGLTEFVLPYEKLQGVIDEKWLPEARQGSGEFSIKPMSEVPEGSLELLDRVNYSQGEELCLLASGTVYDVKLSTVYYADRFYELTQLWCSSYMSDSALQVVAVVPEGIPDLMISYTTADGQRCGKLLSQSGLDGSYLLVDDQINVLG